MPEDSPPQPQTTQPKKVNWKKVAFTVVFIVVAAGVIIAIYWFLILNKPKPTNIEPIKVSTPSAKVATPSAKPATPSAKPSSKKNETESWEVKSLDFVTFKYPSGWEEKIVEDYSAINFVPINKTIKNTEIYLEVHRSLYIDPNLKLEDWANFFIGGNKPSTRREILVDGNNAIYQELTYQNGAILEAYIDRVKKKEKQKLLEGVLRVSIVIRNLDRLEDGRNIFNQFLSTIKFLD